ncbi:MAG: phosphotransferase, partial [Lachnospiraceae bacterium]|nr:phosphotransferase [Lachnospiraceae bacterium]
TMVKVFRKGMRIKDIKKEREYSHTALVCGVQTLIPYDVVSAGDSYGIVIESDHAITLAQAIRKQPARLEDYAEKFAGFLKEMHQVQIEAGEFPGIKDRYRGWIEKAGGFLSADDRGKITKLIEAIPDSKGFVHGNINLNNILVQKGDFYLLDMAGAAHGHAIFDLQGLYASLVMIERERPSYCSSAFRVSGEDCKKFWDVFYAKYMEGSTEEQMEKMQQLLGQYYILKQKLLAVLEG